MSCNQKNRRFEKLQQRCNFSGAFFAMALDSLAFTGFFQLEPVALGSNSVNSKSDNKTSIKTCWKACTGSYESCKKNLG